MIRSSFKSKKEKTQADVVVESAKQDDVVREHVEVEKCHSDVSVEPEPTKSDELIIEQIQPAHFDLAKVSEDEKEEDTAEAAIKADDEVVKKEEKVEEVVLPPPLPPKTISTLTVIDESTEKTSSSLRTLSLSEAILEELDLTLESEEKGPNGDGMSDLRVMTYSAQ